jgi:hypothetical protein
MRLLRMALLIASFAVLFGAATATSMAAGTESCGGATPSGLFKPGSAGSTNGACSGTIVIASKQCCSTSICNCTVGGVPNICQGGQNKGIPNPNAPCCIDTATNGCFCQGSPGLMCASR